MKTDILTEHELEAISNGLNSEDFSSIVFTEAEINQIIDNEMAKSSDEIDCDIIDECLDMLQRMYGITDTEIHAKTKRNLKALRQQIRRKKKPGKYPPIWRLVVVASLLVALFVLDVAVIQSRIVRQSSDDQEVYLIQGLEANDYMIPIASAIQEDQDPIFFDSKDLGSAFTHLGYSVKMPKTLLSNGTLESVSILQSAFFDRITADYIDNAGREIIVSCYLYFDESGIGREIEQDEKGQSVTLSNGRTAYISENIDRTWGMIYTPRVEYTITATNCMPDEMLELLNSIN